MAISPKYGTATEPVLASFDYFDIASGLGYERFYGFTSTDTSTVDYHLSSEKVYTDVIDQQVTVDVSGAAKFLDLDFDSSVFRLPRTIQGDCIVQCAYGSFAPGGGGTTTYLIIKLRKWDGTTETEIASAQTKNVVANAERRNGNGTVIITVPQTHFKIGETLRLTVELWASGDSLTCASSLAYSPFSLDGTYITPSTDDTEYSSLIADIPFKINL